MTQTNSRRDDRGAKGAPKGKIVAAVAAPAKPTRYVEEQIVDRAKRVVDGAEVVVLVVKRSLIDRVSYSVVALHYVLRTGNLDSAMILSKADAVDAAKTGDLGTHFPFYLKPAPQAANDTAIVGVADVPEVLAA